MQQTIQIPQTYLQEDNNSILTVLGTTVNELISMGILKEQDIISKYQFPRLNDESLSEYMVIQIPNLDQDPQGIEFQNDFLHILFIKFPNLKPKIPEEETCHLYLHTDTESADIHFNDSTLHIFYHYNGQW